MLALLLTLAALASACATPSRRLPSRPIDDPITVPRRMMEVDLGATGTTSNQWREADASPILAFRYGITDRLEWNGLLAFDYALMDDAPAAHAATGARAQDAPFGLVAGGGVHGAGFSSIEGAIVQGGLSLSAVKHLGDRFRVSAAGNWVAHLSDLRERSLIVLDAGGSCQVLERMTIGSTIWDSLESAGYAPFRDWREHSYGWGVGIALRPAHWIDVGGGVSVRGTWKRVLPPEPVPPTDPSPRPQQLSVRRFPQLWASLWATLRW